MLGSDYVLAPYCEFFPEKMSTLPFVWGAVLLCFFLRSNFFRKNFIHLYPPFFGKVGPFTLENRIHAKALKMQGFPNS